MSFSFGLFRFLTYGNLFVVGFLMLFVLMAVLIMPGMSAGLISLLIMVVVFLHNIFCLKLQRAVTNPDVVLSSTFKTYIVLMSILSFIYSMLVFSNLIFMMMAPEGEFTKMMSANSMGGEKPTPEMLHMIKNIALTIVAIHGVAIAVNCILSSVFLNKWKKQQAEKEESTLDI